MVYAYEIHTYLPVTVLEVHSTQNLMVIVPSDVLTYWPLGDLNEIWDK